MCARWADSPGFWADTVIEDFSSAARNLQAAIDDPASVTPIRRRFEWRYGLVDGAPPEARSSFPTRLPQPPREPEEPRGHARPEG